MQFYYNVVYHVDILVQVLSSMRLRLAIQNIEDKFHEILL
jgi:hypothetical protein